MNLPTNKQILIAREFAEKAHAPQNYDGHPYSKHLDDVYNILLRFGFNEDDDLDLLIAAYLHDIIEDTATSYKDLKNMFGLDVAEIVYCMTDELGRNRKEKKDKTYPKIRSNMRSIILKLADRIANVENSKDKISNFGSMYSKEFDDFQKQLRIHAHVPTMWEHLTNLFKS